MIDVQTTRISPSQVQLHITVDAATIDDAIGKSREIVANLRKRPLGKHQLGDDPAATERNATMTRATRQVVESSIEQAVHQEGIRLSKQPSLSLEQLVEEGQPFDFSILLDVVPIMELQGYENLTVPVNFAFDVTDADVDERLEEIRQRSAEVEKDSPEPISLNDLVELSFESFIDGEPYEGSVVNGMMYEVGSQNLPEEFEQGLVGMKTGEAKTVEFDVPADFANEQIAGKKARFDVQVGRVAKRRIPAVDEAFAKDFGYESLEFWRNKIAGELAQQREYQYEEAKEAAARQALANCLVGEVDKDIIDARAEQMFQAFVTDLRQQGISFDEYKSYLNITDKDIRSEMRDESARLTRENLALESLFAALGMELTDEAAQRTADELAEESGSPSIPLAEFTKEQQTAIREMTMHRMATEWLLEHVTFA